MSNGFLLYLLVKGRKYIMYTETNKGFTIITNFGCDQRCKYCISKHHPILQNQKTDVSKIDWVYLEKCVSESNAPTINLSGGGDPFYGYKDNFYFFNKVYDIGRAYGKRLDVHTRIIPDKSSQLVPLFRKIALSIEKDDQFMINRLRIMLPYIEESTKVRVINVLNERMSKDDCLAYIETMKGIGVKQITFRQMFGNRKAYENFNAIKDQISEEGVLFLPDGEYHNYFFTTNNTLYPYFFGNSEEERKIWMKKYEDIEQSCS
jgi:hypothetical protein